MANVALISIEPANSVLNGAQVMGRRWTGWEEPTSRCFPMSSSSYRQSFCFLVREGELALAIESLEASLALELAHGYLRPIEVDEEVGLLAVVGEGMRGTPGLAGRIFTAIFARKRQNNHRHRARFQRADHLDRGAQGRPGEKRARRPRPNRTWAAWDMLDPAGELAVSLRTVGDPIIDFPRFAENALRISDVLLVGIAARGSVVRAILALEGSRMRWKHLLSCLLGLAMLSGVS